MIITSILHLMIIVINNYSDLGESRDVLFVISLYCVSYHLDLKI